MARSTVPSHRLFDLLFVNRQLNDCGLELEVRPPGAPTSEALRPKGSGPVRLLLGSRSSSVLTPQGRSDRGELDSSALGDYTGPNCVPPCWLRVRQVRLMADAEIRHCDKYAAVNCLPDIPVPTVWRYGASAKDRGAIFWSATISYAGAHQHA
jgi:hypothetical protein